MQKSSQLFMSFTMQMTKTNEPKALYFLITMIQFKGFDINHFYKNLWLILSFLLLWMLIQILHPIMKSRGPRHPDATDLMRENSLRYSWGQGHPDALTLTLTLFLTLTLMSRCPWRQNSQVKSLASGWLRQDVLLRKSRDLNCMEQTIRSKKPQMLNF